MSDFPVDVEAVFKGMIPLSKRDHSNFKMIFMFFANIFCCDRADVRFEVSPLSGNGLSIKVFERNISLFNQQVYPSLGNRIGTDICFVTKEEDGYSLEYSGQDNSSLILLITERGDIVIPDAQNTNYKRNKSWGFKTTGTVINRGESAFAGFYTQCRETHNLGVLKTKWFEMLQPYIFNKGIIHSGDTSETATWGAYTQYLPQLHQPAEPHYESGLFDDCGITLIEGTLKLMHLKHRARSAVQITRNLQLENSSVENHGNYIVDESITGNAPVIENHMNLHIGFLNSAALQVSSWVNRSSLHVTGPSEIWARDNLENTGGIFGRSFLTVGCERIPRRFGMLQAAGQLRTKIGVQARVDEMQAAYDQSAFFSPQKIIIDVVQHTDHLLNTITDHYTVDQYGNKKYSHRTETGYVFQHRTTERTPKEVDANSAEVPPEIARLLQEQKEQLDAFKKKLDALKEKLKQAGQALSAFDTALEQYLSDLDLDPDEVKSIMDDRTPCDAFRKLYQQRSMRQEMQNLLPTTMGLFPRFDFNPIQWAQANAGNIFEALLQGGDWLANVGRRSSNPYVAIGSQGYSALRGGQKTQQALNKAQIFLSRRQGGDQGRPPTQTSGTPHPPTQPARVQNPPKAENPIWKGLRNHNKTTKTNGETGSKREYYQWDETHRDIEVFNSQGIHKGSMNHKGEIYKGPQGYRIEI